MARFTLQLFGTFRIEREGVDVTPRGRKTCGLLAFLALAPRHTASREAVAELLWTERGTDQSRASLRQAIAELRVIEGAAEALSIERATIALRPECFAVDLHAIHAATNGGELTVLAAQLSSVGGQLLENLPDLSPGFEDWLAVERPRQLEKIVRAVLAALEASGPEAETARMEDAQAILRSLDRLDPGNEAVARLGMRLDHAAGDNAALHRRYRRLSDQLGAEFAAAPSEATQALFQQLTRRAPNIAPSLPAASAKAKPKHEDLLPVVIVAPPQTFGACEMGDLESEYCADTIRTALSGMPGMRVLATEAARLEDLTDECRDALAIYLLTVRIRGREGAAAATLQLADAADRSIVWSQSLNLEGGGFGAADIIAAKAAGAVRPAVDQSLDRLARSAPPDMDSERSLFTRARLLIRTAADLEETQTGAAMLEQVIARNPRHLGARLLLARMYNTDFWQQIAGHDVQAFRMEARKHMQAAAAIGPDRPDVRVRRAWTLLRQGGFDSAANAFDAILSIDHLDPDIVNECAFGYCHLGNLEAARHWMQRAFYLNPFPSSDYHADYAVLLALARQPEAAEEHFLVSGATGLQYDAVRLANLALCSGMEEVRNSIRERFASAFRKAWLPPHPPQLSDVGHWVSYTFPFKSPAHADFLTSGLQDMLEPSW